MVKALSWRGFRPVWNSPGSARPVWGTEGREFKSPQPDKEILCLSRRFAVSGVSMRTVRVRSGRIVNIVSRTAGIAFPHTSVYASAKAGLVRFTDCLAAETIEYDERVFALGPGLIHTEIIRSVERSDTAMRWMSDVLDGLSYLSPDIPAWAVVYLASGRADALSGRWGRLGRRSRSARRPSRGDQGPRSLPSAKVHALSPRSNWTGSRFRGGR